MSQPPSSALISNTIDSQSTGSTNIQSNENSKFNFVDMTKDVEFKTRNKGDKSLKVNKQFRYNKRFQNNFFIFKTGQQPGGNDGTNPNNQQQQSYCTDASMGYYQIPFGNINPSILSGLNGCTNLDNGPNMSLDEGGGVPMMIPSTSTNPLMFSSDNQQQSNHHHQYRVNGRFAKRSGNNILSTGQLGNNTSNFVPPYITNSETFNLLNSNAQLMLLMGSSFNPNPGEHQYQVNDPLISLMNSNQSLNQDVHNNHGGQQTTSYFLEEEEEEEYVVDNQCPPIPIPNNGDDSRKTVTRSNSFSISAQDINLTNSQTTSVVQRAMSAPTIVFEKSPLKQTDDEGDSTNWLVAHNLTKNKKRQRKSFLFTSSSSSSSSGSSSGISSSESSVQNSNSNSPNTGTSEASMLLQVVNENNNRKKDSSPQHKKKNVQQEQFELEFLETNHGEEPRDELDMLLDSIILENNQFN